MGLSLENCVVAQSGGPTAVINSSLCGVVTEALNSHEIDKVYGSLYGIEGIMKGNLMDFGREDKREIELLKHTPSSALGSCRYKLKSCEENEEEYKKIFKSLNERNIKYFFYIGGNDSMDTVFKLSKYAEEINSDIRFIGIPKTIDNDLVGTDHTPGFGSAAKYLAASVMEIGRDGDVYDVPNVHVVEVMGRNAGFLAAACSLAKDDGLAPDLIYLPERYFSLQSFLGDIEKVQKSKKKVTVVVSEGIEVYLKEHIKNKTADNFGHVQLGGVCNFLKDEIKKNLGVKVKGIEMNILQRAAAHMQSGTDVDEAFLCGKKAVSLALLGKSGIMTSIVRLSNNPYESKIDYVSVSEAANMVKPVPDSFINEEGNYVTGKCLEYLRPLVAGDISYEIENGLYRFSRLKKCI